ncbi:MAG: SUMF1/EgtB/PvdO family nonheme iron enzyme [Planctomycetes bacterium]|nr:SUMF1/EgtB/PvdO family nonheme iron enzyme [Planctomycetota bacterium]
MHIRIPATLALTSLAIGAAPAQAVVTATASTTVRVAPGAEMSRYTLTVPGTAVEIAMVPLPAGTEGYPATFRMGSPGGEAGRHDDEGPQVEVRVEPFWMAQLEVTWDAYDEFRRAYAAMGGKGIDAKTATAAEWADAVSLPTPLYEQDSAPILNGMGTRGGYPVANITQFAARQFTKWLTMRTGHFYRLPTEAEWEYAARAGTTTAWFFGDDPAELERYAIYFDNSAYDDPTKGHPDFGAGYRKVGSLEPNPWGLHDMYGNVSEWVIDAYRPTQYAALGTAGAIAWRDAIAWPTTVFPCVVRGGSWESEPEQCRSASRLASTRDWQARDPQIPKSVWWFTDGFHVGFRIVRPLAEPDDAEKQRFWESPDEGLQDVIRAGGKEIRVKIAPAAGAGGAPR